jgi:hypothetical protein
VVPEQRHHMHRRGRGGAVDDLDPAQDVVGVRLRVLDGHVEVAVVAERRANRVEQLILRRVGAAAGVFVDEIGVRKRDLRILVEHPRIGVRRRVIEIEVVLLDVLAVVAFGVREAEQPLLQDGVTLVPERQAQAQVLIAIGEAGKAVLVPAIRAASRVVVRQILPGAAVVAVVLANRAPRAVADVGAPSPPVGGAGGGGGQATVLGGRRLTHA